MKNIDFKNKRVLMRVDFNVPLNEDFIITDDTRMKAAIPTINHILRNGGSIILMSHLGRPQKQRKEDGSLDRQKLTLRHLVAHLSSLLARPVEFADDCIGESAIKAAKILNPGEVLLLENTRFYAEEEKGDEAFAKKLSALGDIYINDAFGTAHRAHASTTKVANFFTPENKSFGFLMESEVKNGNKVMKDPERPLTAIIGGAKVSDKILLLEKLIDFADHVLIGGGMAYTFLKAKGGKVGKSLVEEDRLEIALQILAKAKDKGVQFLLPADSVIADSFSATAMVNSCESDQIPESWMGLDIGMKAIMDYEKVILNSKTILWNGPMGVFEMKPFAKGTKAVAEAVARATSKGAFSLIGGGDSVAAINQLGLSDEVSFVSTGGGAMLEFLEGKTLPGVAAIEGR